MTTMSNQLTDSKEQSNFEKIKVPHIIEKFSTFCVIQMLITLFTNRATFPYLEPGDSSRQPHILVL
jgi:hypothetical protein